MVRSILDDVALTESEFRGLIERALRARGVSAITAARSANLNRDAIRSVLRGRSPSFERTAEICDALGLDLHIGLSPNPVGLDRQADASLGTEGIGTDGRQSEETLSTDVEAQAAPLTRFTTEVLLPVHDFETCSPEGHLSRARKSDLAPAPVDLSDSHACYVHAAGHSMVPAGVWSGDYCLVSPCAKLATNQRVWLRSREGHETLKWLVRLPRHCYEVIGWGPPDEDGHQIMVAEQWKREDVVDRGAVLAVYRGRPSVGRPPFRAADWRPEQVVSQQLGLDEDAL